MLSTVLKQATNCNSAVGASVLLEAVVLSGLTRAANELRLPAAETTLTSIHLDFPLF